jgi:hypothetical protein
MPVFPLASGKSGGTVWAAGRTARAQGNRSTDIMKTRSISSIAGAAALVAGFAGSAFGRTTITDWNSLYQDAIRNEAPGPLSANAGPGAIARAGAMMHTAMFNAVNATNPLYEAYGGFNFAPAPDASKTAAAAVAAHRIITSLYLDANTLADADALLATTLAGIPDNSAKANGIALGEAAASHIQGLRSADGWDNLISYTPGTDAGDWQLTQPGSPVHPHWGTVTPFGIQSGAQFRPDTLAAYGTMENFLQSDKYRDDFNEVKAIGRIDSWTPADEEYQIAFFWGNDRYGTYKPPGHLNHITQTFANQAFSGLSSDERLEQEARLYALLNMAMADAGVVAWDCKYNTEFDLWRPITAIQQALTDGNPETSPDPTWEPLNHVDPDGAGPMSADPFSPLFPAYMSGHATFGAAHAAVMRAFFGSDTFDPMLFGTDDPFVPGLEREFSSWSDMAHENGLSRIYLGVHWRIDSEDAYVAGTDLADWVFANNLRPVPAPSSLALLAFGGIAATRRRR